MFDTVISKSMHRVLADLTQENRLDVALPLAIKDLLRLKLMESSQQQAEFTRRYGMEYSAFKHAWEDDLIPNKYSYEVERDFWDWEAAVADEVRLKAMLDSLL